MILDPCNDRRVCFHVRVWPMRGNVHLPRTSKLDNACNIYRENFFLTNGGAQNDGVIKKII